MHFSILTQNAQHAVNQRVVIALVVVVMALVRRGSTSVSVAGGATKCHGHHFTFTSTHLTDSGEEVENDGVNCVHHDVMGAKSTYHCSSLASQIECRLARIKYVALMPRLANAPGCKVDK